MIIKNYNKVLWLLLLLVSVGIANAAEHVIKTGYFTRVYVQEHETDMPRKVYLLIEGDGTISAMGFWGNNKSSGQYTKANFDPRDYYGKTITIDVEATGNNSNNEFIYYEGGKLIKSPILSVLKINSFIEASTAITAPSEYKYPRADTILMPHDILIPEENYDDKEVTKVVKLADYVQGAGTVESPYISTDGFAGLKEAIADLPDGGTIEVASGEYKVTSKNLAISRFVSIKGVGESQPNFILTQDNMWKLKGSNTIDNISMDMRQNDRRYTHEVIGIDNNARDVKIVNSTIISNYAVDPNTYEESGSVVVFRLYSHLKNISFEKNKFINSLRAISTKGQKNHHGIYFKENLFEGQCHMCITLDQVSNITDVVIKDNTFSEFSHFGVALARINDAKIINNTFYSRNLESFNTYNQAIHIEEHCQNLLIENNEIDVTLRNSGTKTPNSPIRSYGMILSDTRLMTIKNNDIKHSDIVFSTVVTDETAGFTVFSNNRLEDGGIQIKDSQEEVMVMENEIVNPPEYGVYFSSTKRSSPPFGGHHVTSNKFTKMDRKYPFKMVGEINNVSITDNEFIGCDQKASTIQLFENSTNLEIADNTFYGVGASGSFELKGSLPTGNTIAKYQSSNKFLADCIGEGGEDDNPTSIKTDLGQVVYPNPVQVGETIVFAKEGSVSEFVLYDSFGSKITTGTGSQVDTLGLSAGVYLLSFLEQDERKVVKILVE
ncbi:right-handed parallel beta-helix repeat-containing protein [Reichenbachiella versicolor]|uniref:right-handed parallel beta-helix repeat-containing protein n=1 Tax=Reichenbachiella versicolor TaxID=1821036 RepID=UPI000D6E5B10|nr:right-handed parallel beta-helix repeat-containing protein [Reichenbachiella versicolor]